MDLGTGTLFDLTATVAAEGLVPAGEPPAPSRADELLASIRKTQAGIVELEIAKVRQIAAWADQHTVDDEAAACTITERGLDTGLAVAGPGAPLVSDFAVMQLSAVLGRTLDSGRLYVGQVVELAHRLPKLWARVLEGRVAVWKALRVAERTRTLSWEAAGFVDRQLALIAAGMTWAQVDRLVDEALIRFDPAAAEEKRKEAAEHRHFDIDLDHLGPDGLAHLSGTLDAADALDLDAAIARRAKLLGQLGNEHSLDVRRSLAAGELARHDLLLDLEVVDEETGEITRTVPGRKIELIVHLNADDPTVGRLGNTRTPIGPEQVREWIGTPGTTTIIRPVLNLAGHQPVDAYETPDRIRRQVALRDPHCVFPHCTKPAERCDVDHLVPHGQGGPTCPCNQAPLCRGHHRLKTAGIMTYRMLTPGTYHWTGPTGTWLVDPTGSHDLTPPPDDNRHAEPPDQ